jgi:hypothetical protein
MTGSPNQIEWAVEIKARVAAEFDRVAKALEEAQADRAVIEILEDKRAEVMARDEAGYFIVEWQELRDQVRLLIGRDPRFHAIKASNMLKTPISKEALTL